jgi:succinyl-diaminopimelate desuccinylase
MRPQRADRKRITGGDDVIALTRTLIGFDTSGPRGDEEAAAMFLGNMLAADGFTIRYNQFAPGRLTLLAEKGLKAGVPPLVMTGHLDTVPLGAKPWKTKPFTGTLKAGKLFGRGASDMKGGVAAMICAAQRAFRRAAPHGGLRFIFTAAEEPGCLGAKHLAGSSQKLGHASAIVVGEPTANIPFLGHKGGLFLKVSASGRTAHSSMPELGENAIYKVARAITRIERFRFDVERDELHGLPTINVGRVVGGENPNSVPDHAEFSVDIRTTARLDHAEILARIARELGPEVTIETCVNLTPVSTSAEAPFARLVFSLCGLDAAEARHKSLPYVTDGAVLQQIYGGVPTIILGPGEPAQAHRTDEFCEARKLKAAVALYESILLRTWELGL